MVQGDAYSIDVEITNEGQTLSPPAVSLVEVALLNLVKTYPGDVTFSDGKFHFPPHAAGDLRPSDRLPHAGAREVPERRRDWLRNAADRC